MIYHLVSTNYHKYNNTIMNRNNDNRLGKIRLLRLKNCHLVAVKSKYIRRK